LFRDDGKAQGQTMGTTGLDLSTSCLMKSVNYTNKNYYLTRRYINAPRERRRGHS